jgi:hypothetical protein
VRGNQQDTGIAFDNFDISRMLNGTDILAGLWSGYFFLEGCG